MNTNMMDKVWLSNIYGELVGNTAPAPTIQFGVNGSNAKLSIELQEDFGKNYRLTFIQDMADVAMSQICYNKSYISQIKAVAERFPIFNTFRGRIMTIGKTYAKIVANWICHFIDPSILSIATIQDMIIFMVYQFGYVDNLKAFVHYDFSGYNGGEIPDNNKFVYTEYLNNAHFLDKRDVIKCDMDNWVIHWGISDSVMDLVEVVTSCCNKYYFEYGWHFHYPEFELLSKCEIYADDESSSEFIIPVCSRNMNVIREKLGLYNKEQKESQKQKVAKIPLLDIEELRTYMKQFSIYTQRYVATYPYINIYFIFNQFIHQCKLSGTRRAPYGMITFTGKYLSADRLFAYTYNTDMNSDIKMIHFSSISTCDIKTRYVINHVRIVPNMSWPYCDYNVMMDNIIAAISDPLGKITKYRGRGYTKN